MILTELFNEDKVYLGLDPSRTSTGIVLVHDGIVESWNSSPSTTRTGVMAGVLDKEEIKSDLRMLLNEVKIDVAVVEKVFFGGYISSFIKLVEIMNMTEELIIEGSLQVDKLIRVQNTTWKSWLREFRSQDNAKLNGNQGKEMVNDCLTNMGLIHHIEEGKGWQDRVDAFGMLVGYQLQLKESRNKYRFNLKDMLVEMLTGDEWLREKEESSWRYISAGRITSNTLLKELEKNPHKVLLSKEKVSLGFESLHMGVKTSDKLNNGDKGFLKVTYTGKITDKQMVYDEWINPESD